MKPRNREITIFNLSMLDVISGAVGAFLIITVVLFPSYAKNVLVGEKNLEEFRKVRESLTAELEKQREKPSPDPRKVEDKNRELKQALAVLKQRETESAVQSNLAPVLVVAFGGTAYDVALAVLPDRPGVPAFDHKRKELWRDPMHYAGTPPGFYSKQYKFEIIPKARLLLVPRPIPGVSYRLYYKLTRAHDKDRKVSGQLSYGENTWKLPWIELNPGQGGFAGSFKFDEEGTLSYTAPNSQLHQAFVNLNQRLLHRLKNEERKKARADAKKKASGHRESATGNGQ